MKSKQERINLALLEYKRIIESPLIKYQKIRDTAYTEYEKIREPALSEYNEIVDSAKLEYEKIREPAWSKYEKIRDSIEAEQTVSTISNVQYLKINKDKILYTYNAPTCHICNNIIKNGEEVIVLPDSDGNVSINDMVHKSCKSKD